MTKVKLKDLDYYKSLDKKISMIPLTYDRIAKAVFGKNPDILKEFLILELDLDMKPKDSILEINNVELPADVKKEYKKSVDILVTINDSIITDLEFNRKLYSSIKHRNILYFGKLYGTSLKEGEKPEKLKKKKLYQLNINAIEKNSKIGEDVYRLTSEKTKDILIENYAIFIKNIDFYRQQYYNKHKKLTKKELWLVALSSETFEELYTVLIQILDKDKVYKFMEEVIGLNRDEALFKEWELKQLDELTEYTGLENARNEGISQGISQGIKQGINENKIEVAKKMLEKNMDIKEISEITGLTEEEIEDLK